VLANLAEAIEVNLPGTIDDSTPSSCTTCASPVRRTRSILRHGRAVLPADVAGVGRAGDASLGDLTEPPA
jgi:hypothetical protein